MLPVNIAIPDNFYLHLKLPKTWLFNCLHAILEKLFDSFRTIKKVNVWPKLTLAGVVYVALFNGLQLNYVMTTVVPSPILRTIDTSLLTLRCILNWKIAVQLSFIEIQDDCVTGWGIWINDG